MAKTAIILGATGLTGNALLQLLLESSDYDTVKIFGRSTCGISHPKIKEYIIDLFQLEDYNNDFIADVVFCCIGTTKAKTPDQETYLKIDFGIPVSAAKLCEQNSIKTFIVISALGADKNSSIFYNRTKGRMEEAVLNEGIKHTYILQPSLISGSREEYRFGELMAKYVMKVVNPFLIGKLKKYRSIHPQTIATCMVYLANNTFEGTRIESGEIKKLAKL
jgi:uncharacterized protein YbjT (DUF2867 family)